ncbi:hypothetical protein ACRRTK_008353 [Alexandromys fortis]
MSGNSHPFHQDSGDSAFSCPTQVWSWGYRALVDVEDGVFNAIVIFEGTLPDGCWC